MLSDSNTIAEGKKFLRENFEQGTSCPCCGQFVKQYKFKLNSAAALSLISLYMQSSPMGETLHISKIAHGSSSGGNFAQLAHWKLIKSEYNTDTQKRRSGMWQITDKGIAFVKNQISVPAYMLRFDSKCLGFSEEQINIKQALGTKFDYSELMQGSYDTLKEQGILL